MQTIEIEVRKGKVFTRRGPRDKPTNSTARTIHRGRNAAPFMFDDAVEIAKEHAGFGLVPVGEPVRETVDTDVPCFRAMSDRRQLHVFTVSANRGKARHVLDKGVETLVQVFSRRGIPCKIGRTDQSQRPVIIDGYGQYVTVFQTSITIGQ
ncbi:MAG: hypothetical protein ABIG66_00605 [Candidatus Kerfeldbacteria bacterium]